MSGGARIFAPESEWFFKLYAALANDADGVRALLGKRVAGLERSTDPVETGLILFLLALYAQKTGNTELVCGEKVSKACDRIVGQLEYTTSASCNDHNDIWVLAVWVGALRNINLFLKREDIARAASGIKNHVYASAIGANVLMSSSDRKTLGFDLLFSCVPMGLFEPEDLVLVAAVKALDVPERIARASGQEKLLLAWYYAEQGNYPRARALVGETARAHPLKTIVEHRLLSLGQLEARFINHRPMGNSNRYDPMIEERFVKLVTDKDQVIVRAQSVPFSADDPLELVVGETIIAGSKKTDCWEFSIAPMEAGTRVCYQLRFVNAPHRVSESFEYEVLNRQQLVRALGVRATENEIVIQGENCAVKLKLAGAGELDLEVRPGFCRALPNRKETQNINLGEFVIAIVLAPFSLAVSRRGNELFCVDQLKWLEDNTGKVRQIEMSLNTEPCAIFGLGERYNALDQYGNWLDQFVYNQYKDQGVRTYMPMPVFYSDKGFGIHLNTYCYSWFDFGVADKNQIAIGVEDARIDLQIFSGSVNDQAAQFIARTGEPQMVPDWALGPWMSSNNWDSEAEVRAQVALTIKHQIPATVLVIEAWSDEATFYIFNDAIYAETDGDSALAYKDFSFPDWGRWPDPKGLVAYLHENDLKCLLWQIPIIKQVTSLAHRQKSNDEAAFVRHGYGVKNADGSPYRLPEGWFKDALLLDFTNIEAKNWWFEKRQYLLDDIGVDGFKTDGGECVFGHELVFADGSDGAIMRNKYPNDYIAAYYQFAQQNNGITFSRSSYSGAQQFPAHWAGDERSSWSAFKRSLLAGLSAGMSGVIFWGWDLAGFSGPVPDAELYIRSVQMACFCPIMQYHAESKAEHNQDRTPWNIAERSGDDRALSIYRFYANLRMSLMAYLVCEAKHCVAAKTPLMRAMVLDYQNDSKAKKLWDQYLFGRDLLVAPVITKGQTGRSVYLPAGNWWHLFDNKWFAAGEHQLEAGLEEIPVFVRAEAIVPLVFDEETCLGGAMPSAIEKPAKMVLLVANWRQGENICQTEDGGAISLEWNEAGEVRVKTGECLKKQYFIAFASRPVLVLLNGEAVPTKPLLIANFTLAAVSL